MNQLNMYNLHILSAYALILRDKKSRYAFAETQMGPCKPE
jgi:hypothetical protein